MFFFIFGFLCGIYIGQEVPSVPKLKPTLHLVYDKLFRDSNSERPSNSEPASKTD